jgi:hypothetical protein
VTISPGGHRLVGPSRLGNAERWLLLAFVAAGFSVFLVDAVDAAINNRVFVGADGRWAHDQLQYLAWATDAAHHGLIANLYAFRLGGHVFLHPLWLLTGLLHVEAGLSYALVLALWKVVALVALFVVLRRYARSILGDDRRAIVVAMLIALFMLCPSYVIARRLHLLGSGLVAEESLSVYWINGYFPIALAVAAMMGFLLEVSALVSEDDTSRVGHRRRVAIACAAGLAASWLHPWQGMTLIVIVAGLVLWERPSCTRHAQLLLPILVTAAPLVYYAVLPHVDAGWAQSQHHTAANWTRAGDEALLITLLPVALLALPGYFGRAKTSAERMLRIWPVAIVVVFIISPSDKFHALAGCSVPAALLMVRAWPWFRARLPRWSCNRARALAVGGVCVAVAAAPGEIVVRTIGFRTGSQRDAEIPRDDARALDRIGASSLSGGVLTTGELGAWVPAVTDHATWVGHPTWTPAYDTRNGQVTQLFNGSFHRDPALARRFVQSTGARFVLEPCGSSARLGEALLPAGFRATRIGCATLYWHE